MRELKGIEAELYRFIVFDNMKISKAIEKTAEKNYVDDRTIWRIYHKTIKEHINKLKLSVKCQ